MRQAGLRGCPKKRYRNHSSPAAAVKAANLLQQDFSAEQSNERWVSDITYIPTRQGWLYLAVVMDLYSRRIIGWSIVLGQDHPANKRRSCHAWIVPQHEDSEPCKPHYLTQPENIH